MIGAGLGMRHPSNVDEERFLGVALEMLQSGNWLIPHRAAEIYPDKPPLFMWAIAALSKLGVTPNIALFLPALLAGVVATACLHDLGTRLWNRRVGMIAGLLFLATYQTYSIQRAGQIDGLLLLWIAIGLYGMLRHLLLGPAWAWFYVACAAMGFGIISKGVGFLPALLLVPYAYAVRRGWSGVTRMPGEARAWALGLMVALAAIATWLVPLLIKVALFGDEASRAYLHEILLKQTAKRYVNAWHHREPFWFFFTHVIPKNWLPLVLALPWLVPAWRRQLSKQDGRYLVLLGWVVLVLIFFSLSSGKRKLYIYPAIPGLVLAIAPLLPWLLRHWFASRPRARKIFIGLSLFWFAAWFARGFIEPVKDGANPRQVLMAQAAEVSRGAELVLSNWREGHWLYARQPLVHFGVVAPNQVDKAAEWLRQHPDAYAMIRAADLPRCFTPEKAKRIGDGDEEDWYLVQADADNNRCHDPAFTPQSAYRFTWKQPLD
ncbi:dolichyl-phosphate-mannose--protein mannosyltransferase [Pseudomonas alcaligenes]|uniref:Dolichyl-phosphate-mannose--protein mannosyltransferase n=1 Tax=Aquipseudomonas alcaligenes TaxID=43263 RepID=A0ABR7S193_AQUAC|nr:glycosyltransferase family 39 protein [Pseudomonas alcaligenes]MBC9250724.1 dolichyl-phosphate-mannose--protein mannosyltransferase [Pseudomonas alcaligenes]